MSKDQRRKQKLRKMGREINRVEHIHCPPEALPDGLILDYPQGACVIWTYTRRDREPQFTGAIPADGDQTEALARLMAANDSEGYVALRTRLCGGTAYEAHGRRFFAAMGVEKVKEDRERAETRTKGIVRRVMKKAEVESSDVGN